MNPIILEQFGFKELSVPSAWSCTRLWGYRRNDTKGRQFVVSVRYYDFKKYNSNAISWDAISQFRLFVNNKENITNVKLFDIEYLSPEEIIDWFLVVWQDMGASYEEKWGD